MKVSTASVGSGINKVKFDDDYEPVSTKKTMEAATQVTKAKSPIKFKAFLDGLKKTEKRPKTFREDSKYSQQSGSSGSKKSKKKWYKERRVDTKNSIQLSTTKVPSEETKKELDEIRTHNNMLHDENRRLREDMERQMQEIEELKKSLKGISFLKNNSSSQSIKLPPRHETPEIKKDSFSQIKKAESSKESSKEIKTAKPNVAWSTLVNIFKAREQTIPKDPQPIRLKSEPVKHKPLAGKSLEKRNKFTSKHKNVPDKYYEKDSSEEEYILIEEEEESEDSDIDRRDSGVTYHW